MRDYTKVKETEAALRSRIRKLEKVLRRVLPFLDFAASDYEDGASEHSARFLAGEVRAILKLRATCTLKE